MKYPQLTDTILMIAPSDFAFNEETAGDNEFQNRPVGDLLALREYVMAEFRASVALLKSHGLQVLVLEKQEGLPELPDAVFPNNWLSTETGGQLLLYPMASGNRKAEVLQLNGVQKLLSDVEVRSKVVIDLAKEQDRILEGTGSLVLDRAGRVAYAALSVRTDAKAVSHFAQVAGYETVVTFSTRSSTGLPFYHTNVVMAVCQGFAVVCLECIPDQEEREKVRASVSVAHEIIEVTLAQTEGSFCANILQVLGSNGPLTVMSETAYKGFSDSQLERIKVYGDVLALPITTIEHVGGGSARCMLAEIFA
jgi:hypothetical protein